MKRGEKGKLNTRIWMLIGIFAVMLGVLLIFLDKLAIRETEAYTAAVQQTTEVTTYQSGSRGTITDRNGVVLAYDETTYNVLFYRDPNNRTPVDSARYTYSLMEAIRIIEEGGGSTIDTFYIDMLTDGTFEYNFRTTSDSVAASRKRNFVDACNFSNPDLTAEEAYRILRNSWCIPDNMPFDEAKKIMSIRQEAVMNSYRAFEGVRIAYDVSLAVVTELDMASDRLTGILTEKSSYRVYPYGHTASHLVGYLSKQVTKDMTSIGYRYGDYAPFDPKQKETDNMLELGYSYNDLVGVAGTEKTMEAYLTPHLYGRLGETRILKNKRGAIVEVLESKQPSDGMNVQLTIDIELQKVCEQALLDNIAETRRKQEQRIDSDLARYRKLTDGRIENIKLAETGAVIVMNVKTGEILALASYPDYDPNMFTDGIDSDEYDLLFGKDSNMPTLNRAIGIRTASGSVFKMATGLAGLMEGKLTTTEMISDHSPYYYFVDDPTTKVEQNAPSCWTSNPNRHANLTLSRALTVSCNYFFYTVADRVGIERLNYWAGKLGMQGTTGVELPGELSVQIGGQKARYDCEKPLSQQTSSLPRLIYNRIYTLLRSINEQKELHLSDRQLQKCADRLLRLMDGEQRERGAEIRQILKEEMNIPVGVSYSHTNWIVSISTWLEELRWKPTYTIQTGIGQGVMLVTPISIIRYVSTIANRGSVHRATILKEIDRSDGSVYYRNEPEEVDSIFAPDVFWDAIMEGMKGVVSPEDGGTASSVFSMAFSQKGYLERISGKTGTAQTAGSAKNIDIENTCWFAAITPREDPEIAIVVFIPNGLSGSSGAVAVEEIVTYWYERQEAENAENAENAEDAEDAESQDAT